jgi:uncharacterized HAD superfamily protein
MKHISEYIPSILNYKTERYLHWLEHYEHFENKEQLALKQANKDVDFRKETTNPETSRNFK